MTNDIFCEPWLISDDKFVVIQISCVPKPVSTTPYGTNGVISGIKYRIMWNWIWFCNQHNLVACSGSTLHTSDLDSVMFPSKILKPRY